MLFLHYSLNLNSVQDEFIQHYKKELEGAQVVARKEYKGVKFAAIHFILVDEKDSKDIN